MYCFTNHGAFHLPNCGLDLDRCREHLGIPDPPLELCGKAGRSGLWGLKCENPGSPAHAHVRVFWRRWRGNERFPAALVNAEQPSSIRLVALREAEHEVHLVRWENQPNNFYLKNQNQMFDIVSFPIDGGDAFVTWKGG